MKKLVILTMTIMITLTGCFTFKSQIDDYMQAFCIKPHENYIELLEDTKNDYNTTYKNSPDSIEIVNWLKYEQDWEEEHYAFYKEVYNKTKNTKNEAKGISVLSIYLSAYLINNIAFCYVLKDISLNSVSDAYMSALGYKDIIFDGKPVTESILQEAKEALKKTYSETNNRCSALMSYYQILFRRSDKGKDLAEKIRTGKIDTNFSIYWPKELIDFANQYSN